MTQLYPSLAEIRATARRLDGKILETPVWRWQTGVVEQQFAGGEVWLKLELFQKNGTFKLRGAINCIEALDEALARHGRPDIFNTDQGSQFTSASFTGVLLKAGIAISMDGKGSWRDNVFVERLWRSVKYEEVYLKAYDTVSEARASIGRYFDFYNTRRPHSSLDRQTPDQAYFNWLPQIAAA